MMMANSMLGDRKPAGQAGILIRDELNQFRMKANTHTYPVKLQKIGSMRPNRGRTVKFRGGIVRETDVYADVDGNFGSTSALYLGQCERPTQPNAENLPLVLTLFLHSSPYRQPSCL
jgi:hypothetical protein